MINAHQLYFFLMIEVDWPEATANIAAFVAQALALARSSFLVYRF